MPTSSALRRKVSFGIFIPAVFVAGIFIFAPQAHAVYEISDGSVRALYHMEGASSSVNGYHLTNTNVSFNAGKLSNGADTGATNTTKYFQILDDLGIQGGSFSVSLWVNVTTAPSNNVWVIFEGGDGGSHTGYRFFYNDTSGTKSISIGRARQGIANNYTSFSSPDLGTGTWHHIVLTYNASGSQLEAWKNGVSQGTASSSGDGASGLGDSFGLFAEPTPFSPDHNNDFPGKIDEVVVLNRALTSTEISNLYNGGDGNEVCTTTDCDSPPAIPSISSSSLQQLKSDGTTSLSEGSSTIEDVVVFKALLNSSSSNNLEFQVQISTSTSFTNVLEGTSVGVASGTYATATISYIPNGNYYWRARVIDTITTATSSWLEFGTAGVVDFIVNGSFSYFEISDGSVKALYHLESDANDLSGNNYHLTNTNVSFNAGKLSNAADTGAANTTKYFQILDDLGIQGGSFSVSLWVKVTTAPSNNTWVIFEGGDGGTSTGYRFFYVDTGGTKSISIGRARQGIANNYTSFASPDLGTNTWHHIVLTYNATGSQLEAWKNGVSQGTASSSGNGASGLGDSFGLFQEPGPFSPDPNNDFPGMIDEVVVLNRALTSTEISNLYNFGNGIEVCVAVACGTGTASTPASFYAQIKNTGDTLALRNGSSTSATVLKRLPDDWVVYVSSSTDSNGNPWIADSSRWFKVIDKTDNVSGWMAASSSAGTVYLSYVTSTSQATFEAMASTTFSANSTRAEKIVEAVNWYWSHVSSTDSLYYTGFPYLYSATTTASSTWIFPKQLFYAMASQESGGSFQFNNEIISRDYGHGIMQLTVRPTSSDVYHLQVFLNNSLDTQVATSGAGSSGQETHSFGSLTEDAVKRFQNKYGIASTGIVSILTRQQLNSLLPTSTIPSYFRFEEYMSSSTGNEDITSAGAIFDNRGLGSNIDIPPCGSLQDGSSQNYIRKCYEMSPSSGVLKVYESHQNYGSTTFKYYTNTSQSIYSNIKGGLTDLNNKYDFASSTASAGGTVFQIYEREWIRTAWRYNGAPSAVGYLTSVASKMDAFSDYISSTGTKMVATSSFTIDLANKLSIADTYKTEVIVFSPVTLSITDPAGRSTGIVDGTIKEEIPGSAYNSQRRAIAIFFADDSYTYAVKGAGEGTYGLLIDHPFNGSKLRVYAPAIPVKVGETHRYTVDWGAVRRGENGVVVQVDNEGDGIIDREVTTDSSVAALTLFTSSEQRAPESGQYQTEDRQAYCSDGKDNDVDGAIDFSDWDCRPFIPPPPPPAPYVPPSSTTAIIITASSSTNIASSTINNTSSTNQ